MLVVIAGSGTVGEALLKSFIKLDVNIVLIEQDEHKVASLKEVYDVFVVKGDMLSHAILRSSNVASSQFFIACSHIDSVNILACQLAKRMGAKNSIARVYSEDIFPYEISELESHLGVDWLVSPSRLAGYKLAYSMFDTKLITFDSFFASRLDVANVTVDFKSPFRNKKIKDCLPSKNVSFLASYRDGDIIEFPKKDHLSYAAKTGDQILLSGVKNVLPKILSELFPENFRKSKKMYFAGVSHSGLSAISFMTNFGRDNVCILIPDLQLAKEIEEKHEISVINVDPGAYHKLLDLHLDTDATFVCASEDDADNLTYALNALDLGFKTVIPIVQGGDKIRFFERMNFDKLISPCNLAATEILRHFMESLHQDFQLINNCPARAIIHHVNTESKLIGQSWEDWEAKEGVVSVAAWRNGQVILSEERKYGNAVQDDKIMFANFQGDGERLKKLFSQSDGLLF